MSRDAGPGAAALVTGASRGLGRGIAEALARDGLDVAIHYGHNRDAAQETEAACRNAAARADQRFAIVGGDLSRREDRARLLDETLAALGRLDALVNNAGIGVGAPLEEIQTKFLDMQLGVNLRALILGTREGIPLLKEAGAEHGKALIVNTASLAGKAGPAWLSIYGATKAAVINFTEATEREVGRSGIQCTAFAPGFVDTDMAEFIKQTIPAEEMLKTSDISEALRFLLRVSPACLVSELVFQRPGETI
jgi:NAD(P)-dependent dehydrogenase (short-subunit alcohol dehydrogenase family)